MSQVKAALLVLLGAFALGFVLYWIADLRRRSRAAPGRGRPTLLEIGIGAVTNFFDTLGIGSFAPTTAVYKLRGLVRDEAIPGTLNVGHCLPVVTQAFLFIAIVEVGTVTLLAMIAAAVLGAWLGAGVVAGWPRRNVQIGMGGALLAAASFFAMTNLGLFPAGGDALSLSSPLLWAGIAGNFALGALMTLGVGLYAPCMILVALLGMNPKAAFPIMMGSCAFLQPIGSVRFIRKGSYSPAAALGLTLGGVPAVFAAAYLVKSLPLSALRWLVVAVVTYTAVAMLRSARSERVVSMDSLTLPSPGESA
ncbi:MAG TPA: permease [Thermoanaerobaculia bacterium]